MLAKNNFSIENIKIPDFGAQQMLYTLTRSNIKSTGSVYAYEINYTKGGKTFLEGPKPDKHESLVELSHVI